MRKWFFLWVLAFLGFCCTSCTLQIQDFMPAIEAIGDRVISEVRAGNEIGFDDLLPGIILGLGGAGLAGREVIRSRNGKNGK